jgi:energy-coupling factor transporter ATP-binding protein EcfA2
VDELQSLLSPFVLSTGDIYGRERLNSLLTKHQEVERRHVKLWVSSAGVLDSLINAGTHIVSQEEVERTISAARIYVRNPSFDEALAILKKHHMCIISGQPGIGKTTLARMLLLYFYERKFDVVKIESDISEARAVSYHNKPRFYYYDDFLGQTAQADKLNKNEDQKLLDFMASVRDSKDSVFVLTTREYILNQACLHYEKLDREKFDHRKCIIDLSKYSRRIRAQILYNHLHFSELSRRHLENLVVGRGYVQIVDHENYNPRLIEYLTTSAWIGDIPADSYLTLFLQKLDNPVDIWGHAFRNQLSDRSRHLLFVLTTMPIESRLVDMEQAFLAFHSAQCTRFSIAQRATDFTNALKELDGTFVSTRRVRESVLVRFQNPSIRDFMQNLLLSGESLPELITSLVFFEQAEWLIMTLNERRSSPDRGELAAHRSMVVEALQWLVEAQSCSLSLDATHICPRIIPVTANPAARLATIARAVSTDKSRAGGAWLTGKLCELAANMEMGKLSTSSVVAPIKTLQELGYLESNEGKRLVLALKSRAMNQPSELDDFETLAQVINTVPQSFDESEVESVREAYSEFIDRYAIDCNLTNPVELRDEASRIGNVGDLLQIDTEFAQESLRTCMKTVHLSDKGRYG